ncbi:hypothetical protein NHX12_020221 [Muraenolepis orangiensis]|uniref:Uncharacterized protein n=1 Tax=Muraenolepis orangiensis TaxID=630683 RepID=A0A9Q0EUG7_9TELE|nr:hypothetical protein NHX12_020221 [Muraenolepis orangiensis]
MGDSHVGVGGHVVPATNGGPLSAAGHEEEEDTPEEDTLELRLMMAYAQRRRPRDKPPVAHGDERPSATPSPSPSPPVVEETKTNDIIKKKKKNKKKHVKISKWLRMIPCVGKPKVAEGGQYDPGERPCGMASGSDTEEEVVPQTPEGVDELATTLIELADVSFHPPDIETDSEDDEMERLVGLLLRTYGDQLQEQHGCDKLFSELLGSYNLFPSLMSAVFRKMGLMTSDLGGQGPKDSQLETKTKIAVTCEVASRLSAADTLPMNRVLGFGARYLKEHCSVEAALKADEESDSEVE